MSQLTSDYPQMIEPVSGESGAKRRQIMDGAREVFLASGFDGASMNDIARVAGVSKGTLYVYFASKEQLFEALIREERQQQAERLCRGWDSSGSARDALFRFGCTLLELMSRPETLAHVRLVIAATGKFPQLGRAFFEAGPQYGANTIKEFLRARTEAGELQISDPDLAAWQFLELCQARIHKSLVFGVISHMPKGEIEANVAAGLDVFMAAYGRHESRA